MKVHKLEFNFFCGAQWSRLSVEITAINKFQLIREFLKRTSYMNERKTQKQLWKENEKYIEETTLTFPIVLEKDC